MAAASSNNPGARMAAAVDADVALYRSIQEDIQKLRSDQQTLMGQLNENEMVKQELDLLDDSSTIYKQVGPVLMKNDLDDAKQTVEQRLELISGELKKVEKTVIEKQTKGQEIGERIQKMQSLMQQAAAQAAHQIAQEQGS
uniref:Prefoldin subunit 6 n=1 Tax=Attheya septentrionalis TaxID=420275 RepID=A0A7S2UHU7_9STRA|mmetsp:Transcript_23183/g.41879  ORF Transcript_23183/g.41879 Transcript_23183/m.41879 type:complete len:141 (+) Transcript_23183:36-458(+)